MNYLRTFSSLALWVVLPLMLLPARAWADTEVGLESANRAFQTGHYEDAARLFQDAISLRGYSAPLCFDLANAQFKAGHLGPALLDYERARYLDPGDADINRNLQLARHQAGLEPDPYRWWQVVIRSINWTVWLGVIAACLVLLLAAMIGSACARAWTARTQRPVPVWPKIFRGIFFACIPLCLFFGFVELSAVGFGDRVEGVVVTKGGATLRLSPFDTAERTGSVPEGELVTVEQGHEGYFWIDDRSRQSGWVDGRDLEPVVPGGFGEP